MIIFNWFSAFEKTILTFIDIHIDSKNTCGIFSIILMTFLISYVKNYTHINNSTILFFVSIRQWFLKPPLKISTFIYKWKIQWNLLMLTQEFLELMCTYRAIVDNLIIIELKIAILTTWNCVIRNNCKI